jgi:hypothetical protein
MKMYWIPAGLMGLCIVAGCGRRLPGNKSVYPVQGKILLNGAPVKLGFIELEPVDPNEGVDAQGLIKADGTFTVGTYSKDMSDGAVPGEYKVKVKTYNYMKCGPKPQSVEPTDIPKKYARGVKKITVKAEDNTIKINLES